MIVVSETGERTESRLGRRLTVEEILAVTGGPWRIEATIRIDGVAHYCLAHADSSTLHRDRENPIATRMCGRIIWGPAVFVIRGEEMS